MQRKTLVSISVAFLAALSVVSCATRTSDGLANVENIVVIYAENRSFDHLYGLFPGAEGLAQATAEQKTQLDHDGKPLPYLPPVYDGNKVNARYPQKLPNGPFQIGVPPINGKWEEVLPSPIHNYYQNREQINGGKNNMFVAMTTVGAWAMGYFDGSKMKVWKWAREYTLADHFFMGAFGGSYLNHQWLICACTPMDTGSPDSAKAQLDESGRLKKRPGSPASVLDGPVQLFDGRISPDGYVVNTSQPPYQPSGVPPAPGGSLDLANPAGHPLPAQTVKTIGDTLSAKNVSWVWYAGGYNAALADGRQDPSIKRSVIYTRQPGSPIYQPHHQPFNYYARFAPGTADRAQHLKDGEDFMRDIDKLLTRLRASPQWASMVVIVTYDENGGFWDHVPPPSGAGWADRWGPGTRIPTLVISPFARKGFVDKTVYDTTSILKLITRRFGLEPLPGVRQNMGDLTNALAF